MRSGFLPLPISIATPALPATSGQPPRVASRVSARVLCPAGRRSALWTAVLTLMVAGLLPDGGAQAQSGAPPKPPASVPAKPAAPAAVPPASAAQKPAPPPKAPDPALKAEAEKRAGNLMLASADGERSCPVELKAVAAAPGFALSFGAGGCPAVPFTTQVAGWLPDASGSIVLISAQGRQVAEFTEGAGGAYEALREGDGVYFLAPPAVLQEDMARPEEMLGTWDLSRTAGAPLCRWVFGEGAVGKGGFLVTVMPGCDSGMAAFSPTSWRLEGGNVLVTSGSGASTLRFARQEDGGWAKVPERGRPLLMSRP